MTKKFEFDLIFHRGRPSSNFLNEVGAQGWDIAAAYAVPEAMSTTMVHHYVLRREIKVEDEPAEPTKGKRR